MPWCAAGCRVRGQLTAQTVILGGSACPAQRAYAATKPLLGLRRAGTGPPQAPGKIDWPWLGAGSYDAAVGKRKQRRCVRAIGPVDVLVRLHSADPEVRFKSLHSVCPCAPGSRSMSGFAVR